MLKNTLGHIAIDGWSTGRRVPPDKRDDKQVVTESE